MGQKVSILIVEDNPGDILFIEEMLLENQEFRFQLSSAKSLNEAVKIIPQGKYDIILLDLGLPDSGGIDTLNEVIKLNMNIPVLVITGLNDEKLGRAAIKSGAQGYVVKGKIDSALIWQSILYSIERNQHLEKIRKSEKALKLKNQYLNQISSEKDLMIKIISHDLRTPFNSTLGLLEELVDNFDSYDDLKKKKFLNILYRNSQKTYNLIENLLEWAGKNIHDIKVDPVIFNLYDSVELNIAQLQGIADRKEIQIKNLIPPGLLVNADKNLLNTVIRNLLTNSLKFTDRSGKIEIGKFKDEDEMVFLYVRDDGKGIHKINISEILDPRISFSTSGTKNEKGTGLGIPLCKEIIEKHKGNFIIESEAGKGTTIYFSIPRSYS